MLGDDRTQIYQQKKKKKKKKSSVRGTWAPKLRELQIFRENEGVKRKNRFWLEYLIVCSHLKFWNRHKIIKVKLCCVFQWRGYNQVIQNLLQLDKAFVIISIKVWLYTICWNPRWINKLIELNKNNTKPIWSITHHH